MSGTVHRKSASELLSLLMDGSIDMIYTDPPFGTGNMQTMNRRKTGVVVSKIKYCDKYDNYMEFLEPHVRDMHRVLKDTGTLYLHLDWRWSHYAKVMCDDIFGYENFLNDIVWSYNFGGRSKDRWPTKHDNILVYVKNRGKHTFNWDSIDRIPYATPEIQYIGRSKEDAEKRIASGQVPTDVWNLSIVGTASKERVGYPNQKPVKLIKRSILASSNPGETILDPFAGSGTTAAAALQCDRNFIICDNSFDSIEVMKKRFSGNSNVTFVE